MKNKPKLRCTLILAALWAVACLAVWFCYNRFDGALGDLRWYLCVYGPVLVIAAFMRGDKPAPQQTPRWAQALIFYLCTGLVYVLFLWGINPLYLIWTWEVVLMLVFAFIGSRLHLHPPKGCADICGGILFYGCYLLTLIAFLLIFRPLTVQQVCTLVESQPQDSTLDFSGWSSNYSSEAPLGTYMFTDDDSNFYYYNVTNGDCIKKQTLDERLSSIYSDTVIP